MEYVKNKVLQSQEPKKTMDVVKETYEEGGVLGFYRFGSKPDKSYNQLKMMRKQGRNNLTFFYV